MKKTNLFFTLVLFNISFACSQIENYPQIEDFDENSFSIEKVIDGIEIPWGLSFTSNNSFLVTDKKGIMYHVSEGKKRYC
jgi:glucose/arabinose dehydrogenase